MNNVLNVTPGGNINSKKIHKKLTFELGEEVLARIVELDKLSGEVFLKLLDGWQFKAKLKMPIQMSDKLLKFAVEGFENGDVLLKLIGSEGETQKEESYENTLKDQGINVTKEDYEIVDKMIKHRIPLTNDNISKVRTLVDFKEKIILNDKNEDNFIFKYMENRGIDINSNEGKNIKNTLKNFFSEFKKLSADDICTFIENDISITKNNIESFNKIVKGNENLYHDIMELENEFSEDTNINSNIKENNIENKEIVKENENNLLDKDNKKISTNKDNDNINKNIDSINKDNEFEKNQNKSIKNGSVTKELKEKEIISSNKFEDKVNISNEKDNIKYLKLNNKSEETCIKVKDEIELKTNEMKELIKQTLDKLKSSDSKVVDKFAQILQNKLNDFKMYNSISNQYYYLDIPLDIQDRKYPCKLIIKDERSKGKKIDSSNVKLLASVKTINMGTVDAYIKVFNKNINVDVKCEKKWMDILSLFKGKIIKRLNDIGYNSELNVQEKIRDTNIVECRDFFEDNDFTRINTKV